MAKRVSKTTNITKKAPVKKTVIKTTTIKTATIKKAPPKKSDGNKPLVTSGKKMVTKKSVKPTKKAVVKKPLVTAGKKTVTNKPALVKVVAKKKPTVKVSTTTTVKNVRTKFEYVKVAASAKSTRFTELGERVQKGELQWAYYSTEDNVGYHFYKILK